MILALNEESADYLEAMAEKLSKGMLEIREQEAELKQAVGCAGERLGEFQWDVEVLLRESSELTALMEDCYGQLAKDLQSEARAIRNTLLRLRTIE